MQRIIFRTAGFALLAFVAMSAIGAICTWTPNSDSGSQAAPPEEDPTQPTDVAEPVDFPTPGPTFPWKSVLGGVAEDVQDGLSFARELIGAGPPFVVSEPEKVVYVEATVGAARDLLDPNRTTKNWEVPDDVPAVIIVAYGRFQWKSMPGSVTGATPGPTYTSVWVVVPLGQRGTYRISTNDQHDLTRLGEAREVALPLPPFPTPVSLGAGPGGG